MVDYKLILFDLDRTLADFDSSELFLDAKEWFERNPDQRWVLCSNQGGVGLRHWMETGGWGKPEKYPTLADVETRLGKLFPHIAPADYGSHLLICTAYQANNGSWAPTPYWGQGYAMWNHNWRKPAPGMLLHAMSICGVKPAETLMVGDSNEDQDAADYAECNFRWAWEFFGREKPE